jgi:hypothetical protein
MSFDCGHVNVESVRESCWSIALAVIWATYVLFIAWTGFWGKLSVPHMVPIFADLYAVLSASDCHILGYDVFRQNPCDPWGRPHVYGGAWLLLGQIGLGQADALWAGFAINVVFMLLVTALLRPSNAIEFLASLLLVCSPAVLFAMERANVDLIIFALICFSAFLVARKDEWSYALGVLVAYAATLLKLYPAAALITIPLMAEGRRRLLTTSLLVVGLLLAWITFDFKELLLLSRIVPRPEGPYAFGGTLLFKYLGIGHVFTLSCILASVLFISALLLTKWVGGVQGLSKTQEDQTSMILYCMGFALVFFCFLANTNFDYRFIFFLTTSPWLVRILRSQPNGSRAKFWVLTSFALMILFAWSDLFILRQLPGSPTQQYLSLAKAALSWMLILFLTVIFLRTVITQRGFPLYAVRTE